MVLKKKKKKKGKVKSMYIHEQSTNNIAKEAYSKVADYTIDCTSIIFGTKK